MNISTKGFFTKKFISVFLAIFTVLSSLFFIAITNVSADDKIDYSLECENCDKDRLFTVDVYAKGNNNIAAVGITISFNDDYMDFRSISGANEAFALEHTQRKGKVSSIILCSYGYKFKGKAKLVSFKFKSIKSGTTTINLTINDPVNSKCKSIPIGNVYSTRLTINDKGVKKSVSTKSARNSSSGKGIKISDSTVKSKTVSDDVSETDLESDSETESASEDTKPDQFNDIDKTVDSIFPYFITVLCTLACISIILIAYKVGKNSSKSNNDDESE